MTAIELLFDLQRQGFILTPLPGARLAVKPADRLTDTLRQRIRQCKEEVVVLLTRPYLNARGELIVPFTAPGKYHWWNKGQTIRETLQELGAPPDVVARYIEPDSEWKRQENI